MKRYFLTVIVALVATIIFFYALDLARAEENDRPIPAIKAYGVGRMKIVPIPCKTLLGFATDELVSRADKEAARLPAGSALAILLAGSKDIINACK